MTSNIFDLIKKKKAELSGKKETVKPNPGNNFYVILPSWKGQGEAWRSLNRHWIRNANNEIVSVCACTMEDEGRCEVCNAVARARNTYQNDPVMAEVVNSWRTNRRVLFNVLEVEGVQTAQGVAWRAKNLSEVKVLETPITLAESIYDALLGLGVQGVQDPMDLHCIYPLNLIKSGSGKMGTKYSATVMMTPIRFTDAEINTIGSNLVNLDDFVEEDASSRGKALAGINASLGEEPAMLASTQSVQMITAPVATAPQVSSIVNDLSTVIQDDIPSFTTPSPVEAYNSFTPQVVEQPTSTVVEQPAVQEMSAEQIGALLGGL